MEMSIRTCVMIAALVFFGCSEDDNGSGDAGMGGAAGMAGKVGTGGNTGMGGEAGSAGQTAMGGATEMDVSGPCGAFGPEIRPAELPDGVVGAEYLQDLEAPGGPQENVSWSVTSGELPPGIELDAQTGTLSGTPTTAGEFTFSIQADIEASGPCGVAPGFAELTLSILDAPVGG